MLATDERRIFLRKFGDQAAKSALRKKGTALVLGESDLSVVYMAKNILAAEGIIFCLRVFVKGYPPTNAAAMLTSVGDAMEFIIIGRKVYCHLSSAPIRPAIPSIMRKIPETVNTQEIAPPWLKKRQIAISM